MTNGDKIRAMTDEELLEHRYDQPWCCGKFPCKKTEIVYGDHCLTPCDQCFYNWVKSEAKE